MTRVRLCIVCLAILPWLCGCIDLKVTVKVNKDGSGTVERVAYAQVADMGSDGNGGGDFLKSAKEDAEQIAQEMGEGVKVKSVQALPARADWKGVKMVFAFEDINTIKVDPSVTAGMRRVQDPDQAGKEKPKLEFAFTPGDTASLTVTTVPIIPDLDEMGGGEEEMAPESLKMFGEMFDGAKWQITVEVDGSVTKSDARYVSPSRKSVGLVRVDLGQLFKEEAAMKEMPALAKDPQTAAAKLNAPPFNKYLKFEPKKTLKIEFE